ncbi:MAG TPA: class I SAM-dependent methyltransferase [Candidatus Paceibacterota bacterium]
MSENIDVNRVTEEKVAEQYEQFPYPHFRDIAEIEPKWACELNIINHHLYGGQQNFEHFAVLDAGCGIGDSVLDIARQLATIRGEHAIYAIDLSESSLDIARKRLEYHGLIDFVTLKKMSILDVPAAVESGELPRFDYVICNGVLHHMENPLLGLKSLKTCLKPDGFMYVMLYAKYGRYGIDALQQILRLVTHDVTDKTRQIEIAKTLTADLSGSNIKINSTDMDSDEGVYDLLLHTKNYTFTVADIYDMLDKSELKFVDFTATRCLYSPLNTFKSPVLEMIEALPLREQHSICELYRFNIANHTFWTSVCERQTASFGDLRMIPDFAGDNESHMREVIAQTKGREGKLKIRLSEILIWVDVNNVIRDFILEIDGKRSTKEICIVISKRHGVHIKQCIDSINETITTLIDYFIITLRAPNAQITRILPREI